MTITSRLFITTIGAYSFSSALLANVIILCVCRQGLGYDCIVGVAPGNREAQYSDGSGTITFQNPFIDGGTSVGLPTGEMVYVRYKY